MLTFSGKTIDYLNPTIEMICIEDIARGLSSESRFNGQTEYPYFVAQHSVLCSHNVPFPLALEALLHDATEAYMKDIPSPLKALLPEYKIIEQRLDSVIRQAFGLPPTMSLEVHDADQRLLDREMRSFTSHLPRDEYPLYPFGIGEGYEEFMSRFETLTSCQTGE